MAVIPKTFGNTTLTGTRKKAIRADLAKRHKTDRQMNIKSKNIKILFC